MTQAEKTYATKRIRGARDRKLKKVKAEYGDVVVLRKETYSLPTSVMIRELEGGALVISDSLKLRELILAELKESSYITTEKLFTEASLSKIKRKIISEYEKAVKEKETRVAEINKDATRLLDDIWLEGGKLFMTVSDFDKKKY